MSHAERLGSILGRAIRFVPDVCGEEAIDAIRSFQNGEILCLVNVRMHNEEISLKKAALEELRISQIVLNLAPEFDAYVTDAFAAAHRNSPTLQGLQMIYPVSQGA